MAAAERVTTVLNLMAELEEAYKSAERDMTHAGTHSDFEYFNGKMNGIRECINTLHFSILRKHDAGVRADDSLEARCTIVAHEEDGEPIFASERAGDNG